MENKEKIKEQIKNEKLCGIYKITSPTGKIYIGQSIDLLKRKNDYIKLRCKDQIRLFNSINKHGWDNHVFEIIEQCEINLLNQQERYWQDFYNVLSSTGLNCRLTTCTDKSGKMHPDSVEKMREKLIGHIPWNKGLTKEDDDRLLIFSEYCKNERCTRIASEKEKESKRLNSPKNKPVIQLSKTGEYIAEFISISEAQRVLNLKTYTSISECCSGKRKSAYGFKWEYKIIDTNNNENKNAKEY